MRFTLGQFVLVGFIATAPFLGIIAAHAFEVSPKPLEAQLSDAEKQPVGKKQCEKKQISKADTAPEHKLPVGGTFWSLFRPVWSRTNVITVPETAK
jgi:hypothetical protein